MLVRRRTIKEPPKLTRRQRDLEEALASVKHRKPKPVSLPAVRGLGEIAKGDAR